MHECKFDKKWQAKGSQNRKLESEEQRKTQKWIAGDSEELGEGGRLVIEAGDHSIGIFRVKGSLYAYHNVCAHLAGPVCQGLIVPRVIDVLNEDKEQTGQAFDEDDPHIACPWHGFEYSIRTGKHASIPDIGLKPVPVEEEGGIIYVTV